METECKQTNGQEVEEETFEIPLPKPETAVVVNSTAFDLNLVCDRFLRSINDKSAIEMPLYLQGFTELNK